MRTGLVGLPSGHNKDHQKGPKNFHNILSGTYLEH